MSGDYAYYRVLKNSPVMDVVRAAERKESQFRLAMVALERELGASSVWFQEGFQKRISGAAFVGDVPTGWRQGRKYAVPDKRTKAGREIAKRLEEFPRGVSGFDFSQMLSDAIKQEFEYHGDCRLAWSGVEQYGATYVLVVPAECRVKPPKCVEMKMSEYWRVREKAEKAPRASAVSAPATTPEPSTRA